MLPPLLLLQLLPHADGVAVAVLLQLVMWMPLPGVLLLQMLPMIPIVLSLAVKFLLLIMISLQSLQLLYAAATAVKLLRWTLFLMMLSFCCCVAVLILLLILPSLLL